MSNILDQMMQRRSFTPANVDEYVALQCAKRLKDEASIARYVGYLSRYSLEHILRCLARSSRSSDPAAALHSLLNSSNT